VEMGESGYGLESLISSALLSVYPSSFSFSFRSTGLSLTGEMMS
jgi:hypothetical protein